MLFRSIVPLVFAGVLAAASGDPSIVLNDREYFEAPGFSFLLFHNNYKVGYQGGLQMIQNGERLLDSGDVFLMPKRGPQPEVQVLRRSVDRAGGTATVFGEIAGIGGYRLICRTDGKRILVTLKLDRPVDWSAFDQAGFRITLYQGAYYGKSFQGDRETGVFPRQYTGDPVLVRSTPRLRVAQEDPLRAFAISRSDGPLSLLDQRAGSPQGWYSIIAPLQPGSDRTEVGVTIEPSVDPSWRRTPVIGISQAGYHPSRPKRAVIELDKRESPGAPVTLYKLQLDGGRKVAKSGAGKAWGRFLRYNYEVFDFSDVREPGLYMIETRGQAAGPFRIDDGVYGGVWKPTLQYFLPAQMCHVAVREGSRTWHGACHLDDARQAPEGEIYIDGYRQGARETRFKDNEHIPGLDWGGWHDAGDNDLPAGSIANTTLMLALAQEEFNPKLDETSVDRDRREVRLHVADGRQDLIQQIEYGVEGLLASYRVGGHIFPGIIESSRVGYGHLGDPVNITDNRVDEGAGSSDDRWAFTNRNTGLQYNTAQALAAAARVLRGPNPAVAAECLKTARSLFEYEQAHEAVYPPNAYVPRDSGFRSEEISAAAELLLTTQDAQYRDRLVALRTELKKPSAAAFAHGPGWVIVRALPEIKDAGLRDIVLARVKEWKTEAQKRAASNPYGVHLPEEITNPEYRLETRSGIHSGFVWGPGWNLQEDAVRQYYFHKHSPELFGIEPLLATVDFVLGCHPASNQSYVSGVGAHSPVIAYGFNRADWSHIPGGVISGASLIKPDYMELKEYPFLWYQTEYVIGGAATYIFDVLAAHALLNK